MMERVSTLPWDALPLIAAPPGTSLGASSSLTFISELPEGLSLDALGVYTPWATRTSDLDWEVINNPDTNIATFALTDALILQAQQLTFGHPIPFVAVITAQPMTSTDVAAMWDGTAYKEYETQAVYRQDDAKDPPTIYFIHWGERIDMSQLSKQVLAIEPRAAAVKGRLVFAAQVPVQTTSLRAPPSLPFNTVLSTQMSVASLPTAPVPAPAPVAQPTASATSGKTNLGLPIAVGLGAAVLGFVVWRKTR